MILLSLLTGRGNSCNFKVILCMIFSDRYQFILTFVLLNNWVQHRTTEHDLPSGDGYFSPMLLKTCSYFTLPSFVPFNSIWYMLNAHSQKCNEKEVGCKENVSFSDEFSDFSPYRIHRI